MQRWRREVSTAFRPHVFCRFSIHVFSRKFFIRQFAFYCYSSDAEESKVWKGWGHRSVPPSHRRMHQVTIGIWESNDEINAISFSQSHKSVSLRNCRFLVAMLVYECYGFRTLLILYLRSKIQFRGGIGLLRRIFRITSELSRCH